MLLAFGATGTLLAAPKSAVRKTAVLKAPKGDSKSALVAARYPLDPICPWGRIGDGQGILVRCLEQQEAIGLLAGASRGAAVSSAGQSGGVSAQNSAGQGPASGLAAAPPSSGTTSPDPLQRVVFRSVGKARPDSGSLPEAKPQLSKPKQRYVQCVEMNGGIDGSKASVVVRFLVRERGRAEGVAVKSRRGMTQKAAQCIAEVVDRRYVGFPEVPIGGVTLEIRLAAEKLTH